MDANEDYRLKDVCPRIGLAQFDFAAAGNRSTRTVWHRRRDRAMGRRRHGRVSRIAAQSRDAEMLVYLPSLEKRYLLGQDPRDIESLWERVYRNEYWRRDFFVC